MRSIKEVQKQRMLIEYISTNLMIVNPLAKELPQKTFNEHVKNIDIIENCEWLQFHALYVFDSLSSFNIVFDILMYPKDPISLC